MGAALPLTATAVGDLFGLPPLGESRRNCTAPENLDQARYELHRAIDFGGPDERLAWFDRWAEAMLDGARTGVAEHERACMLEHDDPAPDDVDTGAVEDLQPRVAVAGEVDVEQGLAELGVFGSVDVDDLGRPVDGDREVLAGQMGDADLGSLSDVTEPDRVG